MVVPAALDYDAITQEPARGVTVEVVNSAGTVLDTDTTDGNGNYAVSVDSNTEVRVRVRSQMISTAAASWNIQVLDNTNSNAIYVLNGSLTNSGTADSRRDLNAPSGWDPNATNLADPSGPTGEYTTTRAAGPFAILDGIYDAVTQVAQVDPDVDFPALQVLWSVNNVPASGNISDGEIGTSSYTRINDVPTIRILGAANNDTDEYDTHVVVHEFGHYFEDQLARSDSPGGSHSLTPRLDARLSFGEGWGNAFSGMILDDPIYRDVDGDRQSSGFAFSVETDLTEVSSPSSRDQGWFNEASVQQILYDIYDSVDDGADTIDGGLAPIYNAFTDPDYINNSDFTTIFAFANRIRNEAAISGTALDALLNAEDINGTGPQGVGETNNGNLPQSLPIYKTSTVGGGAVTVCSTAVNGDTNKHGVREFITLTLASTSALTLTATETSGPAGTTDPDFRIWETGRLFTRDSRGQNRISESSVDGTETWTGTLDAGTYAIEIYDFNNFETGTAADSCFDFTAS